MLILRWAIDSISLKFVLIALSRQGWRLVEQPLRFTTLGFGSRRNIGLQNAGAIVCRLGWPNDFFPNRNSRFKMAAAVTCTRLFSQSSRCLRSISSLSEAQAIADAKLKEGKSNVLLKTQHLAKFQDYLLRLTLAPYLPPGKRKFLIQTGNQPGPMPQLHHFAFFSQFAVPEEEIGRDGTDRQFNAPEPFVKRMYAGGSVEWAKTGDLILDSHVSEQTEIESVQAKPRGDNDPMLVVGLKKTLRPTRKISDGVYEADMSVPELLVERRQWVFLQISKSDSKSKSKPKEMEPIRADYSYSTRLSTVSLFRYSAIMFNAHRIHLDRKYAADVEGHPSILVQGWFTLQLMAAAYCAGWEKLHGHARMKRIKYRAMQPLYVDEEVTFACNLEKGIAGRTLCVMKGDVEMW
jgi:hydroxyacyl-ACP dehydratase HTD2-like protein with hotdog domain